MYFYPLETSKVNKFFYQTSAEEQAAETTISDDERDEPPEFIHLCSSTVEVSVGKKNSIHEITKNFNKQFLIKSL